jgi:hypothetical protein
MTDREKFLVNAVQDQQEVLDRVAQVLVRNNYLELAETLGRHKQKVRESLKLYNAV